MMLPVAPSVAVPTPCYLLISVDLVFLPHGQFIEINRVADNFPAQFLAHLAQFADLTMPENDDVVGLERNDKILTIASDGDLLAKRHGGLPEGFNDIKC